MKSFLSGDSKIEDGWVRVAYATKYTHPTTGENGKLTVEMFNEWERYFKYLLSINHTLPLTKLHSIDPTDRLGTVEDVKVENDGFYIKTKYRTEEIAEAVDEASFSVFYENDWQEADGEAFSSVLHHVGVTDYPVLKVREALSEFAFLSTVVENDKKTEKGIKKSKKGKKQEEETDMPISTNVLSALGLSEDADETKVLSSINDLKESAKSGEERFEKAVKSEVESRKTQISKLSISDDEKEKLERFTTEEVVKLDLSSGEESLFSVTLNALSSVQPREEDEDFQTGPQGLSSTPGDETDFITSLRKEKAERERQ